MNLRKTIPFRFLENWMFFLISYPLLFLLLAGFSVTSFFYKGLFLFLSILAMDFFRARSKHLSIFILQHVALIFLFFLLANSLVEQIVYTLYLLIASFLSLKKRFSSISQPLGFETLWMGEGVLFTSFLIAGKIESPGAKTVIYAAALLFALSFMAYLHLQRMNEVLEWVEHDTHQAIEPIKKLNRQAAFGFILLTFFLILAAPYLYIPQGLVLLGTWTWAVIRWILRLLLNREYEAPPSVPEIQSNEPTTNEFLPFMDTDANSLLGRWDEYIMNFIFILLLAGLFALLIYGGIQLYRKFHETSSSDEEKVFLSPFKPSLRKESLPLKNVLRSFTLSFGATNEQKIRKIYYKYVQQKILQGISITTLDSPKQIKDKISIPTQDLQSLTEIYEKARYSHHTCTKEDLVEVKKKTSK